ncbi:MAG: hypothetical protein WDM88_00340 [Galbitalea sp.]
MGILDFFMGIQDPVVGSYRITSCTRIATSSSVANCDMVGELSAPGIAPIRGRTQLAVHVDRQVAAARRRPSRALRPR